MYLRRCFSALILSLIIAGQAPAASPHNKLGNFVVLGDSLTAGFQNFSLFTSSTVPGTPAGGQEYGYAQLVAQQAGADLHNPTVTFPGIPSALTIYPNGTIGRTGEFGFRISPDQTFNVSVPSYTVGDALQRQINLATLNPQDALALTILAPSFLFPNLPNTPYCGLIGATRPSFTFSSVACAAGLQPKTLLVSLGSNDALQALTFGVPPTDPHAFESSYSEVISILKQTNARMMLATIPDVTAAPFLWTRTAFHAKCPNVDLGALNPSLFPADYFLVDLVGFVNTGNPYGDVCLNYVTRPAVLVQEARAAILEYNKTIAKVAAENGAIVLDINSLLADMAANGKVVGGQRLTTAFLGGLFSLDGLHPSNTGNAIIANEAIKTMNRAWGVGIPPLSVEQIAKDDPLVPSKH